MSQTRPHDHFMRLALNEAQRAAERSEVPVGAVIVRGDEVIAVGHNQPISGQDPTLHAEIVALRAAAQSLGNYRLPGCRLYVTLEPCLMCTGAIFHARLDQVIFAAYDEKTGVAGSQLNLYEISPLNHQTHALGGVLQAESASLLRQFFQARRGQKPPASCP